MPKVIFFVGGYGIERSTLIEKNFETGIWNKNEYVVVAIDNILIKEARKKNISYEQVYINSLIDGDITGYDNVDKCCDLIKQILKSSKNIIINNPNSTAKIRKRYIDIIPRSYTLEAVLFEVKDDREYYDCLSKGNDPHKTISKERAMKFLKALEPPTKEEGFSNIIAASNI